MGWAKRSNNWTSLSSPWVRAWDGHEVVDLAVGRLALHYVEENPDEVLAALDDKTEAVIRELEAQHKEACRSLRRRRDRARGSLTLPEKTSQDLMSWLERLNTGQVASVEHPICSSWTRAVAAASLASAGEQQLFASMAGSIVQRGRIQR